MSTAAKPTAMPSEPEPPGPPRTSLVADRGAARHDQLRTEAWSSRGTAKVLRDAEVGRADLVGSTSVGGSFRAERAEVRGRLEVVGAVEVRDHLAVRGELRAGSTVHVGDGTVRGIFRSVGPVTAERRVAVFGATRAPSVAAQEVRLEGAILVPDLVRSPRVTLRPTDRSHLGRIEGATVRVRAKVARAVEALLGGPVEVTIGRIDGQRVELEGVEVGFVHADEVVLGRRAHVRTVEGTVVSAHRTSHVGPESRSRPPAGLSR